MTNVPATPKPPKPAKPSKPKKDNPPKKNEPQKHTDLKGTPPKDHNGLGKVLDDPKLLGNTDVLLNYLAAPASNESLISDYVKAQKAEQDALAAGDKVRANQIKNYSAGLKDKLGKLGIKPSQIPRVPMSVEQQEAVFSRAMAIAEIADEGGTAKNATRAAHLIGLKKIRSQKKGGRIDGINNDLSKCKNGKYKDLECKGGHKHHVVADRNYRTGTRKGKEPRAPGTDSLADGFSVCLSDADHVKIHQKTDPKLKDLGAGTSNNLPDGLAHLGDVIDIAVEDLKEVYKENGNIACADEIDKKAKEHFSKTKRDTIVNTKKYPSKLPDSSKKVVRTQKFKRTKLP